MEPLQHQVLQVKMPPEDFNPDFVPEDGEQYLQQVVYERRKCPAVVVKPFKRKKINQNVSWKKYFDEDIIDTSSVTLHPTKEWRKIQINNFAQLRARIVLLQKEFTDKHNENLPAIPAQDEQDEWLEYSQQNEPVLCAILQLSQMTLEILLEYFLDWLNNDNYTVLNGLSRWLGKWIYATLACLQLPLEPSAHSNLRQIARACIRRRNQLMSGELEKSIPFNLLICIISYNFNQKDLSGKFVNPNY